MALFAIADLHLGFGLNKPMDIFAGRWKNHSQKIAENWRQNVTESDTILLPGDISWGMNLRESKADLDFVSSLPGRKIICCGNHDFWWDSLNKLNAAYPGLCFLKNDFYEYEGIAICGGRGWICPNDSAFTAHDLKMYKREQIRLRMSLDAAVAAGYTRVIVMTHYPPTNDKCEVSEFIKMYKKYSGIEQVVYGHLHGDAFFGNSIRGKYKGIEYSLVSADFLEFTPKRIL